MIEKELFEKPRNFIRSSRPCAEGELYSDSRVVDSKLNTFIALKGENFDAEDFLDEVLKDGDKQIICHDTDRTKDLEKSHPKSTFIFVRDTEAYLQELANLKVLHWKKESGGKVVGLTGSNGKTTNKEMLFHLLDGLFPNEVAKTEGNLNNHLGVPFTVLKLDPSQKILILEMGTNHPGEIGFLCEIGLPDMGLITNIGDSHLEFFGSRENVFKEKRALFDHIKDRQDGPGIFLCNAADPLLVKLKNDDPVDVYISDKPTPNSYQFSTNLKDQTVKLIKDNTEYTFRNSHISEDFNFYNLAMSSLFVIEAFGNPEKVLSLAETFRPPENNRTTWVDIKQGKMFLDAYNANPSSMTASLKSFINYLEANDIPLTEAAFILGDMNELGDNAPSYHQEVGKLLAESKGNSFYFIGKYAQDYAKGCTKRSECFDSLEEFKKSWAKVLSGHKYFFVKASRSLQLESLLDIK